MSHFVSAEDTSAPRNHAQIVRFEEACDALPSIPASLCNSSGLYLEEAPFLDLVRPGYALYGGNPTPGNDNPMRRVVGLEATILQVRDIPGGETAGYNARWTAPSRRKLATIGLGYADGFLRSGTGGPISVEVFVDGRFCPVVGRISMDLSIIDISDAGPLRRGDRVEILGPEYQRGRFGVAGRHHRLRDPDRSWPAFQTGLFWRRRDGAGGQGRARIGAAVGVTARGDAPWLKSIRARRMPFFPSRCLP